MSSGDEVVRIKRIDARLSPFDWNFSGERREDIDQHWAEISADKPAMFNGRVLLQHRGEIVGDAFVGRYFETNYADFIAWQRFGYPPPAVRNGFALAALRTRDGAFLLGEMASHTFNAGKIYFAGGTPDRDDLLADGTVDLPGSAARELFEETGLTAEEAIAEDDWVVALDPVRAAFMRAFRIDLDAEEARRLVLSRLAAQAEPELADIHIVRTRADLMPDRMPRFMLSYFNWLFGEENQR
ncbi:MAG: NUDIX hydrolase [Beijerinckiaceae bacterium]